MPYACSTLSPSVFCLTASLGGSPESSHPVNHGNRRPISGSAPKQPDLRQQVLGAGLGASLRGQAAGDRHWLDGNGPRSLVTALA